MIDEEQEGLRTGVLWEEEDGGVEGRGETEQDRDLEKVDGKSRSQIRGIGK